MFINVSEMYEKTKAWSKKNPVISVCMSICGGFFFYKLIFSYMYPSKSNKGDSKITAEKIKPTETKKSIEVTQKKENVFRTNEIEQIFANNTTTTSFQTLNNFPETPKATITPSTTPSSPPTSAPKDDRQLFIQKPVQALLKSEDVNLTLESYNGKYLLLIFYPQNLAKKNEIIALNKSLPKFDSLNVSLVGCSNDSKFSHVNLNRGLGAGVISFPLIGDDKKEMSSSFSIGLDNTGKNKPTTLVFSPHGEILKRIDSIDVKTLLAEAEKLQSNS
jgi:peroxiredoxin